MPLHIVHALDGWVSSREYHWEDKPADWSLLIWGEGKPSPKLLHPDHHVCFILSVSSWQSNSFSLLLHLSVTLITQLAGTNGASEFCDTDTHLLISILRYGIQRTTGLLDSNDFTPVLTWASFKTGIWLGKDGSVVTSWSSPKQDDPNYITEKS